jgi:hypothetical protein
MLSAFVPDHSGGTATVLHRFPLCPFSGHPQLIAMNIDPVKFEMSRKLCLIIPPKNREPPTHAFCLFALFIASGCPSMLPQASAR